MRLPGTSAGSRAVRPAALVGGTSVVLAALLLTGCGGKKPSSTSTPVTTVPAVTQSSPETTSSTTTTTTTPPSSPTTTATPQVTKTRWPKALGEPQGHSAWGVYLAVAHSSSDPALKSAQAQVAKVGYGAVIGDLACDHGAMEALGLDVHDYWTGAVLYFANKKDAQDFASSYLVAGGTVIGTAKIGLGCLD